MSYCKTQLINELKQSVKGYIPPVNQSVKTTMPDGYTGIDMDGWAKELFLKQQPPQKELRKVSEQY